MYSIYCFFKLNGQEKANDSIILFPRKSTLLPHMPELYYYINLTNHVFYYELYIYT